MKAKFVVDVKINGAWVPYKLLTRSPNIRHALDRLTLLAGEFGNRLEDVRIRALHNDTQIADAKISVSNIWGTHHLET